MIRRFFILVEIEYVNASEGKSKELKYFFIWPIFRPQSLTIYNFRALKIWKINERFEESMKFWVGFINYSVSGENDEESLKIEKN